MRTSSERPNGWYVFIPLFIMVLISVPTLHVVSDILHKNISKDDVLLGLWFVLLWPFLIRDVLKQIRLFNGEPKK